MKHLDTITDYIRWQGDRDFTKQPFREADALVLCELSYFDLRLEEQDEPPTVRAIINQFSDEELRAKIVAHDKDGFFTFLRAAAESNRFGELAVSRFESVLKHDEAVQFSAATFVCKNQFSFLAFRGTDSTIAGWKEDFMISFTETEAQKMARKFAREELEIHHEKNVYLGGHSKGANLALYAACGLSNKVLQTVERVFILDGPGFCDDIIPVTEIERVDEKTTRILPAYSVVGKLFEPRIADTKIVRTTTDGIVSHDLLSWGISYGDLAETDRANPRAENINRVLDAWICEATTDERKSFVDEFFGALAADGAKTLAEATKTGVDSFEELLLKMINASPSARKTAAALPLKAAFGDFHRDLGKMGIAAFFAAHPMAMNLFLILCGGFVLLASEQMLSVAVMAALVLLTISQIALVLRRLVGQKLPFAALKERVYICIALIVLCLSILFKEDALFVFGSVLFAVLFFVLSIRAISRASDETNAKFFRVLGGFEGFFAAIYGFSFLVIPRNTVRTYAMSIGCLLILDGIVRILHIFVPTWREKLLALLQRVPLFDRLYRDREFRSLVAFAIGGAVNVFYIFYTLYLGAAKAVPWFVALGGYHLTLLILRIPLIRAEVRQLRGDEGMDETKQRALFRRYGVWLLFLNLAIGGITYRVNVAGEGFSYGYNTIFIFALYAFYALILAVGNLLRYRKQDNFILKIMRRINLFSALVAMYALQTGMLTMFDTSADGYFSMMMNAITGIALFLIMLVISGAMTFRRRRG